MTTIVIKGHLMNILVADDNEGIREMVKLILELKGHTVYEATDGRQALFLLQKSSISYDILLTDYNMPNMTGQELIEQIIELNIDLKRILMFSGEHLNESKMELLLEQYKHIQFMSKPIEFDKVIESLI